MEVTSEIYIYIDIDIYLYRYIYIYIDKKWEQKSHIEVLT